eukprot:SAG11_NODE_8248_length_1041_cov_0.788747_2_plen_48_part_01
MWVIYPFGYVDNSVDSVSISLKQPTQAMIGDMLRHPARPPLISHYLKL